MGSAVILSVLYLLLKREDMIFLVFVVKMVIARSALESMVYTDDGESVEYPDFDYESEEDDVEFFDYEDGSRVEGIC